MAKTLASSVTEPNGKEKNQRKKAISGGFKSTNMSPSVCRGVKHKEILVSSVTELKKKERNLRKKSKSGGFESMNLSPSVYRGVRYKGFRVPTPIQRKTMPQILSGADVIGISRTGSGKTAAFVIPMLEKLKQHVPQGGVRALILSPTRELSLQTLKHTKDLAKFTDLHIRLIVGGESMERQFEELAHSPDIIIATPGRLLHQLSEIGDDMSLHTVEYVVFDEADELFKQGFDKQCHEILTHLSENRQTLLFGATLPRNLSEFAKAGLRDPQFENLDKETKISPTAELAFFTLKDEEKIAALMYLIREQIRSDHQTLIFVSTSHHVDFLNHLFGKERITPSICYGKMDQEARKAHVSRFRARKTMYMIVTDIAARGIDIPLLDNVINFDFPDKPNLFRHRIGRVARAGRPGSVFSFVTSQDMPCLLDLHLSFSKPIRASPTEDEFLQDNCGVKSKIDKAIKNKVTLYGHFPQSVIDLYSDRVQEIIGSSSELTSMQKCCGKAFQRYSKSKEKVSKASVRRAKELPREGLHPMFIDLLGGYELKALASSECLKAYRPKKTILEVEGGTAKSKHLQGPRSHWGDVMKKKRAIHEEIISKVHQQHLINCLTEEVVPEFTSSQEKGKEVSGSKRNRKCFKDDEYFISSVPRNQHFESGLLVGGNQGFEVNRLEDAVLDLAADDGEGLQKQKYSYHWDKRSKKYIKLNNGQRVTPSGKVKTESGTKVKVNETGIYKRWKERSHNKIGFKGSKESAQESTSLAGSHGLRGDNKRFKSGKKQTFIPNAHVQSEIKNLDQIRKARQKKASRVSYLKSKSNKGRRS